MTYQGLQFPEDKIADFCRRHRIARLALFGSVLREDFDGDSDVDVLVEFEPDATVGLAIVEVEEQLGQMLGRKVDLRTAGELSEYFVDDVLAEAVPIYPEADLRTGPRRKPVKPDKDPALLRHMLDYARDAVHFVRGKTLEDVKQDVILQRAVIRTVEVIGEAAARVSQRAREAHTGIPWRKIVGMRHRLIHDYDRIGYEELWDTIQKDLPVLIAEL